MLDRYPGYGGLSHRPCCPRLVRVSEVRIVMRDPEHEARDGQGKGDDECFEHGNLLESLM